MKNGSNLDRIMDLKQELSARHSWALPMQSARSSFTHHVPPPPSRFTPHASRFTSGICLSLALATLLLAGCIAPIGTDRVSTRLAYDQVDANALRTGKPSAQTISLLHRHGLSPLAARHRGAQDGVEPNPPPTATPAPKTFPPPPRRGLPPWAARHPDQAVSLLHQ